MNIFEKVQQLSTEGYYKEQIISKLKAEGYSDFEIENATQNISNDTSPDLLEEVAPVKKESNFKDIGMGILFLGLGASRLLNMRGGGGTFSMVLGIALVGFGIVRLSQAFNKR